MTGGNRKGIAILALVGLLIAIYLFLYTVGAFGTIICGDGGCETVQNSPWAYFLGVPVAGWGVVGYLAILATALAGTLPRFEANPLISRALLALTGVALLFSIYLSILEEFVIHAWCRWCIASAVISLAAFLLALPEVRRLR